MFLDNLSDGGYTLRVGKNCMLGYFEVLPIGVEQSFERFCFGFTGTVRPWALPVLGSRQRTMKDLEPSFLVRVEMLAMHKTLRRCTHFLGFCTQSGAM